MYLLVYDENDFISDIIVSASSKLFIWRHFMTSYVSAHNVQICEILGMIFFQIEYETFQY